MSNGNVFEFNNASEIVRMMAYWSHQKVTRHSKAKVATVMAIEAQSPEAE